MIGGERALVVLRSAVTSAGLPLAIILVLMTFSLIRGIEVAHTRQMKIRDTQKIERVLKKKLDQKYGKGDQEQ